MTDTVQRGLGSRWRVVALVLAVLGASTTRAADSEFSGELRAHWDALSLNAAGPLAQADTLVPGLVPPSRSRLVTEAELRGVWRPLFAQPWLSSVTGNGLIGGARAEGGATDTLSRVNELYASSAFGAWQASAGKKIVGWDVGYGFRPNDFVQQEERRTLLTVSPEGRPLLQLEHYDAQTASSLVLVNPQRATEADDAQRGARESALAARWYTRDGAIDWHAFGRWGHHTGASAGAALAWVATDELELHASARVLQRHDGWRFDTPVGDAPVPNNPWALTTQGATSQWLLGASWTGRAQQSVLVEAWHDGTALPDREWDAWLARNRSLAAFAAPPGLPAGAVTAAAGNLAWQATPFTAVSLRRDNLFVRLAWQPEHWLLSADALVTPSDGGRVVTLGVQWQGDRVRLNAAWRAFGGPSDSLYAQLPLRRVGLLAATWPF